MDMSHIPPFVQATQEVFAQMFGTQATPEAPRVVDSDDDHEWEISGILGIAGDAQGIIAIRMPLKATDELLRASGVETTDEQERLATATGLVGEIINIIAGNAIGMFDGLDLDISPPVVIKGVAHQISWPQIAPVVAVRFSTAIGPFELGVCFRR